MADKKTDKPETPGKGDPKARAAWESDLRTWTNAKKIIADVTRDAQDGMTMAEFSKAVGILQELGEFPDTLKGYIYDTGRIVDEAAAKKCAAIPHSPEETRLRAESERHDQNLQKAVGSGSKKAVEACEDKLVATQRIDAPCESILREAVLSDIHRNAAGIQRLTDLQSCLVEAIPSPPSSTPKPRAKSAEGEIPVPEDARRTR